MRPLRERSCDAGRAPQSRLLDARRRRGPSGDRAGAAPCRGRRDRGDRDRDARRARGRGCAHRPVGSRGEPDDEPRGHPALRRRGARRADVAVPLRRVRGRAAGRDRRARTAGRREAHHVVERQGPERRAQRGRRRRFVALRTGGRPGRWRPLHRRGLHRLRRRDHRADRVGGQRHAVLPADRARAGRRRLPRVVAAHGDGPGRRGTRRRRSPRGSSRASVATASSVSSCSSVATR